ncbi:FAD-binding oxidoreductase [Aggregatilinea lenta]|uniref:FAD-binding oxidoreductase n=1 Tax=Aggregatilinea lenta TaxID=913108 RepID=UPI000E5BBC2A|nr:FAD-binding oxidoreductase [Aggregatilinea lenta]
MPFDHHGTTSNGNNPANETSTPVAEAQVIARLRGLITGEVIAPEDAGYDAARAVFYGGHDRHPAVVVRPVNADEVAAVVRLARETSLELAVRSGGHSGAGHSVSEGGIVLDLAAMRALDIDVENRTAWAEAGLTAGEYTTAAASHGLATGFGDTGSVGIGGITLGGGVGYLVRKYGLTIDDLLAADVVTANGEIVRVDAESHPDLFWALRGGGGNFGVVTRFKFRLHPVDMVVGGMLVLPATVDVISGVAAAAHAAPEELSTIANVMIAPPMPFLPAELHGKLIVMLMLVYVGDVEAGQQAVAPFRALAAPLADMVRPMHYTEMYPPEEGGYHPTAVSWSMFVNTINRDTAQVILDHLHTSSAQMAVAQIRVLGGAMARVPVEATAFAHRQEPIMVNVAALYQNPAEEAQHKAWVREFAAALNQGSTGVYVNFLGNEGKDRVHDAYPGATWDRLAAVKHRYDPDNLFHLNHNVASAAVES